MRQLMGPRDFPDPQWAHQLWVNYKRLPLNEKPSHQAGNDDATSEDGQMKDMVGAVGAVGVRTRIRRAGALAGETGRLEPLRHQMICPD